MVDCKNKIIVFDEVLVCLKKYVVVVTIQKKEKKKGKREDVFMATMQYEYDTTLFVMFKKDSTLISLFFFPSATKANATNICLAIKNAKLRRVCC